MERSYIDQRESGLPLTGSLPWGTSFCGFYQSEEDLFTILVPYLRAGLENNEYCAWVTATKAESERAFKILEQRLPNFRQYHERHLIDVIPARAWCLPGKDSVETIVSRLDEAVSHDLDGVRLAFRSSGGKSSGYVPSLFQGIEDIDRYNVLVAFVAPREKFDAVNLMEAVKAHDFALVFDNGKLDIVKSSEARVARDAMNRSEEKLRSLFSNMAEAFAYHRIVLDSRGLPCDYIFLEVNDKFENLVGLKAKDVIGKRVTQVLPGIEKDPADWIGRYGKVALTGDPAVFESYSLTLKRWYSVSAFSPHRGFFSVMFTDITERKQMQSELKASEKRWATTLESIGDGVIATDMLGNISFMNAVAEKLTGWTLRQVSGCPVEKVFRIINEKTRETVESPVEKVIRSGMIAGLANHTKLIRKDGTEIPIDDSGAPIIADDGKVAGVVLVFRDITERRKSESEIAYLASFPEVNPNPVIEIDKNGNIIYANPSAANLFPDLKAAGGKHIFLKDIVDTIKKGNKRPATRDVNVGDSWFEMSVRYISDTLSYRIYARDITERKQAEQTIKQLADHWQSTFDSITDPISIHDNDFKLVRVNKAYADVVGMKQAELTGCKCFEVMHGMSCQIAGCPHQETVITGKSANKEFFEPHLGIYVETSTSPVLGKNGETIGTVHITKNITERKTAEKSLRQSEGRLRILTDANELLNTGIDPEQAIHTIASKVMNFLGCHVFFNFIFHEGKGRLRLNAYAGVSGEDAQKIEWLDTGDAICGCIAAKGRRIVSEDIEHNGDERAKLVRSYGVKAYACHPLLIEGKSIGTLSFGSKSRTHFTDSELDFMKTVADRISAAMQRKSVDDALRESEQRFFKAFHNSPVAMAIARLPEGRMVDVNDSFSRMVEHPREELIDRTSAEFNLFDATERGRLYQRMNLGENLNGVETSIRTGRGKQLSVMYYSERIRLNDTDHIIITLIDITERKRMEELKDDFIGMVSHELRTPLTIIMGAVHTAMLEGLDTEEQAALLKDAAAGAESLEGILGNLLELSRYQASRLVLASEPLDVRGTVHEVVERLKGKSQAHRLVNLAPEGISIVADKVRTVRILHNLIENAIKYSPQGGEIKITVKQESDYLIIGVSDQGIGISPADQARLFQPFERLERMNASVKGLGLGLVVCRRLVEAHQGRMWVESGEGKGSTFYFGLPLKSNSN